jgi:hypothetical protein
MKFDKFPLRKLKNKKLKNHSIQRGLVWSPKQIGLLWDSILHEIPIGTIMLLKNGDEELVLDGQQRLNAISRGFGEYLQDNPDSVIWVNFHTKDKSLTLMVTTISHPWGYNDNEDCSKLRAIEQRNAIKEFLGKDADEWTIYNNDALCLKSTWPFKAELPIPLQVLLQAAESDSSHFVECANKLYKDHFSNAYYKKVDHEVLEDALHSLENCMRNALNYEIGATIIDFKSMETIETLFNRINKGGTPISEDDLAYSTIKAYFPFIKDKDYEVSLFINPAKLARMVFRIIETDAQNKNSGFANHLSLERIREIGCDKEYVQMISDFYDKVPYLLKQVDDAFNHSKIPDVLKARIADQSTDLYLLMLYIKYHQFNEIDDDFLCGLVFYIHWFARDISKCVNICHQCISNHGKKPDAIRLALAHAVNISILTPLITPEGFDNLMEIKADEKWTPNLSQWNELWDCVCTNKEMLLYFQRSYLSECFRNYKPLNLKMWSEHNTPWDYDHIIPQNWFGNYSEHNRYARFCRNYWLNNIGNLAAIPFETNRSKSDDDDWSYYKAHNQSLKVDISAVEELSKDQSCITSDPKTATNFARTTFRRCGEIYRDCYDNLFKSISLREQDLTQLAIERKKVFERLNKALRDLGEKSGYYYVTQDASKELPIDANWGWNMPWISCGIIVKTDFYVALTCYLDYDAKPEPQLFFEIGVRRNPKTIEIKRELPSFDKYTQYNKDWWYIERDINNEKERIVIENIKDEIMELKTFVEKTVN